MSTSKFQKLWKSTRKANAILSEAGGKVIKTSFDTALQIAGLYKDAGIKAIGLSKDLVVKTVSLTIDNQKEIIKTSGQAIKEAKQKILENPAPELKTMTTDRVRKSRKKKGS